MTETNFDEESFRFAADKLFKQVRAEINEFKSSAESSGASQNQINCKIIDYVVEATTSDIREDLGYL
jgi:hypothetical protein